MLKNVNHLKILNFTAMRHSGFSNPIYFHNSLNFQSSKQLSAVEHLWWKIADLVQNENGLTDSNWNQPIWVKLKMADLLQNENGRFGSKWNWPIWFKGKMAGPVQSQNGQPGSKWKWPIWLKIKMTDLVQNEICRYGSKWPIWP